MLILQAERDSLLKPLQAVTGIVERRHTLPILSNVLIEGRGGQTKLLATDWKSKSTPRVPREVRATSASLPMPRNFRTFCARCLPVRWCRWIGTTTV